MNHTCVSPPFRMYSCREKPNAGKESGVSRESHSFFTFLPYPFHGASTPFSFLICHYSLSNLTWHVVSSFFIALFKNDCQPLSQMTSHGYHIVDDQIHVRAREAVHHNAVTCCLSAATLEVLRSQTRNSILQLAGRVRTSADILSSMFLLSSILKPLSILGIAMASSCTAMLRCQRDS